MLPVVLILVFLHCSNALLTIDYKYFNCSKTTNFTLNGFYNTNLNLLLSTLASNISTTKNGFYNFTAGAGSPEPAFGFSLCRGDVDLYECQVCLELAIREVLRACPTEKKATYWKEECMLHYSYDSVFSLLQEEPILVSYRKDNVSASDFDRWSEVVIDLMSNITSKAAGDQSGKKFATKEAVFSSQMLYTLAQCTPDLTVSDCDRCFATATSNLLIQYQGGIVLTPSCNVRYEAYPFYQNSVPPFYQNSVPPFYQNSVPPADTGVSSIGKKKRSARKIAVAVVVALLATTGLLVAVGICRFNRKAKEYHFSMKASDDLDDFKTDDALIFDLGTLQAATNNFADNQKIGEGGFGGVYKGTLPNGQEIAIKRLSRSSNQGAREFKNEVVMVARLQHRNLVRLLGFCLEGEEKLLVYEFVPNKSLNYFLFDSEKQGQLNWSMRFNIIKGIARGLLYLHEDSRLKIIHRDLKAGNILLDADMNPKISDFGLARILGIQEGQERTDRVVGTFGYMAPEYAIHGQFSVKTDVYSFGVLVLENVSGQKISRFHQGRDNGLGEQLLSCAWRNWRDGTALEFMDPTLRDNYSSEEVLRCIHLALSCVQEDTNLRPTMATVVHILNTSSTIGALSTPQRPGFFYANSTEHRHSKMTGITSNSMPSSAYETTMTEQLPR